MKTRHLYAMALFAACAATGCSEDTGIDNDVRSVVPDSGHRVVLTGSSNAVATRTGFGDADAVSVPLLWSEGDYIRVDDMKSEPVQDAGRMASFTFESLSGEAPFEVYYNRTGSAPSIASVPVEQVQRVAGCVDLGANGDFGYARTDADGVFSLRHYTSYIWFNVSSPDVTSKLVSITVATGDGTAIAGDAVFDGEKLGAGTEASVTLSFGSEGVDLPAQGNDEQVFAAMVVCPADLSETVLSVVYTFADGSRYLTSKPGKELKPGATLRLTHVIAAADCVSDGVYYFTPEGWSPEIPASVQSIKVLTLGGATLDETALTTLASRLSGGAIVDLGDAEYVATEFPEAFKGKTALQEIVLPCNIRTLASGGSFSSAFYSCTNLRKITLPETLEAIVTRAFYYCSKLERIRIPASVESIGQMAFYGCSVLSEAELSEGLTEIGTSAFQNCKALEHVALPTSLTSIGDSAFSGCSSLTDVTLPEGLVYLGGSCFSGCQSIEHITVPEKITVLNTRVFYQCGNLKTVTLHDGVTEMKEGVFYQCSQLEDMAMPASLETIGERVFGGCNSFTRVAINIENVTDYSFWDCKGLLSIELGDKVKSIGRNAFISNGGNGVVSITCHAAVPPTLGNTAFSGVGGKVEGKKYVYVPAASFDAYEKSWATLADTNGYLFEDISDQQLTDGVWYRASREEEWTNSMPRTFSSLYVRTVGDDAALSSEALAAVVGQVSAQQAPVTLDLRSAKYVAAEFPAVFAGNDKLGAMKFFDNTTSLAAGAFEGCPALTEVVIPAGTATIAAETFAGCAALTTVSLPSSVTTVDARAFQGCTSLADLSLSGVKTIGDEAFATSGLEKAAVSAATLGERAFADCASMTSATLGGMASLPEGLFSGCVKLTDIAIPNTVREIGADAFAGCSELASVTLGSGVTRIGPSAFADCALTAVVLPDQVTELGDGAFGNNPAIARITFGAGIAAIGDNAFAGNATIERLTVPRSVSKIGAGAFSGWSRLNTLTIAGDALVSIGSKAFADAVLLADIYAEPTVAPAVASDSFSGAGVSVRGDKIVHVPDVSAYQGWAAACNGYSFEQLGEDYLSEGVYYRASASDKWSTEIPASFVSLFVKTAGDNTAMTSAQVAALAAAVKNGSGAATVDLSEAVYESTLFPAAFNGNANLAGIVLPSNVTAVAGNAFKGTGFASVHVRADITYGSGAFYGCASLTSVTFDEGVRAIPDNMFRETPLASIALPDAVRTIGSYAFYGCPLTSVGLGEGLVTVSSYAFQKCGELTEIDFPDATESIGQNAFAGCVKLAKVSFGTGMKTIEAYSFTGTSYMGGACPLLGDITCRSEVPPTLKNDYGTGPFGGSWYDHAGKDAESRILHLPKAADPATGTGAYVDSGWAELGTSSYGFRFVYDVE